MAKRVSFSVFFFLLSFSLLFWFFRTFSIGFCWPSSLAEIEMTLSVIWFGQRFHWQLARAATGHTTQSWGKEGKAMAQQQVFGVALVSLSPPFPRKWCVIYRQIVLCRGEVLLQCQQPKSDSTDLLMSSSSY